MKHLSIESFSRYLCGYVYIIPNKEQHITVLLVKQTFDNGRKIDSVVWFSKNVKNLQPEI